MEPTTLIHRVSLRNAAAGVFLFLASGASPAPLVGLGPPVAKLGVRQVEGCTAFVERGTLSVIGDESANVIEIVGTADGVQVACDGSTDTFDSVEEIVVEAGDGDDQVAVDNRTALLDGIVIRVFGEGGNESIAYRLAEASDSRVEDLPALHGGIGDDALAIVAGVRADRFDIQARADIGSVQVQLTDVATGTTRATINGSEIEFLSIKGGDGDDEFHVAEVLRMGLTLFGDEGNDLVTEQLVLNFEEIDFSYVRGHDGGSGKDKFNLVGDSASEHYGITPVLDRTIPDPHIQVTDLATGVVTGDFFVQRTEEISIATEGGDDHLDIRWDAASMSGLEKIEADLGEGDDKMTTDLLPVLVAPGTGEVQSLVFDVDAGRGDDQLTYRHSAGSWFDVAFSARLGSGGDRFETLLFPPPDDGVRGPEGMRRLQFGVASGKDDDVVAVQNATGGEFFEVFVEADLGVGDDLFEGGGAITPAARPGRGFDTARVTRNLLPFVTEFERVEVLEEVP
jgi:hypothetical protein